jgi:hypothetical protein
MMDGDEAIAVWDAAEKVVNATAWKLVDDRKVEVSAAEWNAAMLVAKAWMEENEPPRWL